MCDCFPARAQQHVLHAVHERSCSLRGTNRPRTTLLVLHEFPGWLALIQPGLTYGPASHFSALDISYGRKTDMLKYGRASLGTRRCKNVQQASTSEHHQRKLNANPAQNPCTGCIEANAWPTWSSQREGVRRHGKNDAGGRCVGRKSQGSMNIHMALWPKPDTGQADTPGHRQNAKSDSNPRYRKT